MMIPLDILVAAVSCFAAYLVYVVAEAALKSFNAFQLPRALAFVVSMLTLLAMVALGRAIIVLLLIPYAVLGVVLVGLYLTRFFAVSGRPGKSPRRSSRTTSHFDGLVAFARNASRKNQTDFG